MPDPYWQNIGKDIRELQQRGLNENPASGRSKDKDWNCNFKKICKTCGREFLGYYRSVNCAYCLQDKQEHKEGRQDVDTPSIE